jgi:hypothetical protein
VLSFIMASSGMDRGCAPALSELARGAAALQS